MPIFLFIFFVLLLCYAFLIDYYRRSWKHIPKFLAGNQVIQPFISVIIAARNEQKNLPGLINSLRQQTYPGNMFEVIIVDDHSTDESWKVFDSIQQHGITIRPLRLADLLSANEHSQAHKKRAIEKGIEHAKGSLIVTTDADCVFNSQWLSTIAAYYSATNAKFIAAPVKIKTGDTFLSIFQSLDFLTLQGITGASVHKRFHTMCNGANLAYEKAAFREAGGYSGIDNIPSGDDMLLMYKIYKLYPDRVLYLKSSEAIVTTKAENSWKDFFNQRIRWASKATHYEDKKIFWILLLVYLLNICFLVLVVASLFNIRWLFFLLFLLILKIIIEFPFVKSVSIFFNEGNILKYFPLMQPFHIIYTIIAGWLGKFGSYEWKGRRIKK